MQIYQNLEFVIQICISNLLNLLSEVFLNLLLRGSIIISKLSKKSGDSALKKYMYGLSWLFEKR
jgi:hypothetical protein